MLSCFEGLRDDKTTLELRNESEGNVRENDGESDCLSDRSAALDEQRVIYFYDLFGKNVMFNYKLFFFISLQAGTQTLVNI